MDLCDLSAFTSAAGAVSAREELSVLRTGQAVVVDGNAVAGDADPHVASHLRGLAAPLLVVGDPGSTPRWLVEAADACVTSRPDPPHPWVTDTPGAFAAAVSGQPLAALALARLLRATPSLDVADAISAEAATYAALLGSRAHQAWLHGRRPERREDFDEPVVVTRAGGVLRVELNRPHVRNAVNSAVRDGLVAAFELAEIEPSLSVELGGRGSAFCSGGDLSEFGTVRDPATALVVRATRHPGLAAHRIASRLTAHLHGACIGAGVEVPAFAGRVLAAPDTTLRLPELGMGLVPGAGGTVSVQRRVGRHRAAWLAVTGGVLDVTTAHRWGLVDDIVDS